MVTFRSTNIIHSIEVTLRVLIFNLLVYLKPKESVKISFMYSNLNLLVVKVDLEWCIGNNVIINVERRLVLVIV